MPRTKSRANKGKNVVEEPSQTVAEEDIPDLAEDFGAPFPIFSEEEGARYESLTKRNFTSCKYLDFDALDVLKIKPKMDKLIARLGWRDFVAFPFESYQELMMEFYTTLKVVDNSDSILACRLFGNEFTINYDTMHTVFGFPKGGHTIPPPKFNIHNFWKTLSGVEQYEGVKHTSNGLIKDHCYLILHKFMCHSIFGKLESNKVSSQEIFLLWCMHTNTKVSSTYFVFQTLVSIAKNVKLVVSMGHIITGLAVHFGVFDASRTNWEPIPGGLITRDVLVRGEIITARMTLRDPATRRCMLLRRGAGSAAPSQVADPGNEEHDEDNEEPTHASPASQDDEAGWRQVLTRLDTYGTQLQHLDQRLSRMERNQSRQEHMMRQFFQASGHQISSPPPSP